MRRPPSQAYNSVGRHNQHRHYTDRNISSTSHDSCTRRGGHNGGCHGGRQAGCTGRGGHGRGRYNNRKIIKITSQVLHRMVFILR